MSNDFMFEPALKIIAKSDRGLRLLFRYMYFADKIRVYLLSKFHCKSTDHFTYTRCDDVLIQKILQSQGDRFINILNDLGIRTRISNIVRRSEFTRYELQAVSKVEADRIASLINDISKSTLINNESSIKVRIEVHTYSLEDVEMEIPIQIDNVRIHELTNSKEVLEAESPLTVILGCDDSGKIVSANLSRLPHLLIAGSTGSGKSMCIHSMIMSLLYKSLPDQVRFLMIDPKAVELGIYNGIPQLLAPVVTDPRKAAGALNWAVNELLKRYQLFADNGVRDLNAYNRLADENGYQDNDGALPQIVIIIDELADLMVAAPNNVENAICRLTQMARAAGMHLIIATQKPSADVITDTIKANIPSRIAFAVSSQTDSRTILNIEGAEKLHGHGDMLFSPMGMAKPMRVQGCFVSKLEIEAAVRILKGSHEPFYDPSILDEIERGAVQENENVGDDFSGENVDPMLQDAIKFVTESGEASALLLQRRLRIGYARAGNLIDKMEDMGIIGPLEGSEPRKVLITYQQYLEMYANHGENSSSFCSVNQADNICPSE